MSDVDPKVLAAIEQFAAVVGDLDPRVRDLLDQVRQGRDEKDVMADLIKLTMEDPELSARIQDAAMSSFRPLKDESNTDEVHESVQALMKLRDRQNALRDLNFDEEDLVFHPEGTSFPQLHPVVMGFILERLQFDGDIPELRTGDIPVGALPAVPVAQGSRNPIALGNQLDTAAQEVRSELDAEHMARAEKLNAIGEAIPVKTDEGQDALMVRKAKSDFVAVSEGRVGVEGYKAGHVATLRPTDAPSGAALATMTDELRKKYAHKALTSTQGRRSAVPVIGGLVQRELAERGYKVTLDGPERLLENALASSEWTTHIENSASTTQERFAFIDTAARVIAIELDQQLKSSVEHILLHIEPVNQISRRRVGWEAKVVVGQ